MTDTSAIHVQTVVPQGSDTDRAPSPPATIAPPAPAPGASPGDREPASRVSGRPTIAVLADDTVVAVLAAAAGIAVAIREGVSPAVAVPVIVLVHAVWVALLQKSPSLSVPLLRLGSAEFRHVVHVTLVCFGVVAIINAYLPAMVLTSILQVSLPVALVGVLLSRVRWRRRLRTLPTQLKYRTPTLVVGSFYSARATASALLREPRSGAQVVGICLPEDEAAEHESILVNGVPVPVVGSDTTLLNAVAATGAHAVALTATNTLGPGEIRRLIWSLDGMGVDLIVTPGVVDVAGHRVVYQAVSDMPMLHIAQPQHRRADNFLKRTFDVLFAAAALLATLPITLAAALAVKLDSRGPVFYCAERVGEGGRTFRMVKFRSMITDADKYRDELTDLDVGAGVLFKVREDPRVTRVGRLLRRYSIDELPQFLNVLTGDMSVVGPRPALPSEVAQYPPVMRRRHLVKPGITGAWQVNGRSDLSWEESVRLDVGYVENWSVSTDLSIIARTVRTVLGSSGAY